MSLTLNRRAILGRGLGNLAAREVDPTPAASFTLIGYLEESTLDDAVAMEEVMDEAGNLINALERERRVRLESRLLQSSADEINFLRLATGKIQALRYYGKPAYDRFQYYCFDAARVNPSVNLRYAVGKRTLPFAAVALSTSDEEGFTVPEYHFAEARRELRVADVKLWIDPRSGYNAESARILDISGFGYHGTLSADYTDIWQTDTTPERFLRFDGTDDSVSFGDILDDDASADFMIEGWIKCPGSAGSQQEILSKKALVSDDTAGYAVYRNTSNQIVFRLSTGAASVAITSVATVTTTWVHFAVTVDRNGNAQLYVNGAASGSAASVSALATGTNSANLYLGRDGTNYGQVDVGGLRIHSFGAGLLPSDIATVISNHYTGERAYYGV